MNRRKEDPVIMLLLEVLERGFRKTSWHGPNLTGAMRGVRPQARDPIHRRQKVEQVLHAAYWKQRVLNKLIGTQPFPRRGSNWPKLPDDLSARAWKVDQKLLHDMHERLIDAVSKLDSRRLNPKLKWMIYGAAAHDVYHAGQIRLLRRMMGLSE